MSAVADPSRFERAIAGFDAANASDPNQEDDNGAMRPKELLYAERMTEFLNAFAPDAPEEVKLAARAQHIRRWEIKRSDFPEGRRGYLDWRTACGRHHAETASRILREAGYGQETVGRVSALLQKENLKADRDVQLLEDVACLVFLQYYFDPFSSGHGDQKIVRILQKTWRKMSPEGRQAAQKLDLSPRARELVNRALE